MCSGHSARGSGPVALCGRLTRLAGRHASHVGPKAGRGGLGAVQGLCSGAASSWSRRTGTWWRHIVACAVEHVGHEAAHRPQLARRYPCENGSRWHRPCGDGVDAVGRSKHGGVAGGACRRRAASEKRATPGRRRRFSRPGARLQAGCGWPTAALLARGGARRVAWLLVRAAARPRAGGTVGSLCEGGADFGWRGMAGACAASSARPHAGGYGRSRPGGGMVQHARWRHGHVTFLLFMQELCNHHLLFHVIYRSA